MTASADAVIRNWFENLWNREREETIDQLLAVDAQVHGLPTARGQPIRGPEGFKPFYRAFHAAFPDIRVVVERTVTQGNMVAAHCRVTGRYAGNAGGASASGKAVEFWGMCIVTVEDGKITEAWNSFDFLALYQQLGLMSSSPTL